MDRELGELMGKMELVLKELEDIKTRLRSLETFRWKVAGAAILAGSAAGGLAKLLG